MLAIEAIKASLADHRIDDILYHLLLFREGWRLLFSRFLQLLGKLTEVLAKIPMGLLALHPLQGWLNGFALDLKQHRARQGAQSGMADQLRGSRPPMATCTISMSWHYRSCI